MGMDAAAGLAPRAFETASAVEVLEELTVKVASPTTVVASGVAFKPNTTQFMVPADGDAHASDLFNDARDGSAAIETLLMSDAE
jgi:hypothetical protein